MEHKYLQHESIYSFDDKKVAKSIWVHLMWNTHGQCMATWPALTVSHKECAVFRFFQHFHDELSATQHDKSLSQVTVTGESVSFMFFLCGHSWLVWLVHDHERHQTELTDFQRWPALPFQLMVRIRKRCLGTSPTHIATSIN